MQTAKVRVSQARLGEFWGQFGLDACDKRQLLGNRMARMFWSQCVVVVVVVVVAVAMARLATLGTRDSRDHTSIRLLLDHWALHCLPSSLARRSQTARTLLGPQANLATCITVCSS